MQILKEEINTIGEQVLALAKWKIIIVSTAVAAGLGWSDVNFVEEPLGSQTGFLILYSIGYLCIYIDVLVYRRYERIHILAKFIRTQPTDDIADKLFQEYERFVRDYRIKGPYLLSERLIIFSSSLVFSVGSVLLAWLKYETPDKSTSFLLIPFFALLIIMMVFFRYDAQRDTFINDDNISKIMKP